MNTARTCLGVLVAAALVAGCGTTERARDAGVKSGKIDRSAEHEWPPVSLDSSGREHVIVMQGPNPGWRLDLDAVEATRDGKIVYATVHQPDPERMYPQVISNVRLGTTVAASEPVELAVRIRAHDGSEAQPYRSAAVVD
ncbi:MAG TPA: hypothetical protein VFF69_11530 [Phycisphaerales bacterium]|nr:hypothetical protein [Phycisphaerales bacterium]